MRPETRKVQKLGLSSLGISLPKRWVRSLAIQAGSTVMVEQEDDGSLRISLGLAAPKPRAPECIVDADNCTEDGYLERLIIGSYLVGCNTIKVRARGDMDPGHIEEVQRALSRLTGVTPVDQGTKHLTLENFAEPTKFPIEGLLRRQHFLISRMQSLAFQMVTEGKDLREQIGVSEDEVDRLYTFIVRQLLLAIRDPSVAKQIGLGDPRNILGDRILALLMENIADHYEEIAESGIALGIWSLPQDDRFTGEISTLATRFTELSDMAMGAFFGRDPKRANEALYLVNQLVRTLQTFALQAPMPRDEEGQAYCNVCLLLQGVLRPLKSVARLYGSVAHLAISRHLEESLQRADERARVGEGSITAAV